MPSLALRKAFWDPWPVSAGIVPGDIVWIWDHWNKVWERGVALEDLGTSLNHANVIMGAGIFSRNVFNVQKWPGSGPLTLTPADTPSAWYEITNPRPTDPVEP